MVIGGVQPRVIHQLHGIDSFITIMQILLEIMDLVKSMGFLYDWLRTRNKKIIYK